MSFLKRVWVALVVVVAVALGGIAVNRLRGAFGSDASFSASGSSAQPLQQSHVKQVIYEVYGQSGATGKVSFLDGNAQPQNAAFTGLPWTFTIETTVPAVIANVVAQGTGGDIGCRITVDGVVRDEQSSVGHHAQTSCLVKAA
ncbi:MmpS family transport accessory protein [Mycobacterium vicinigordonae]|uniref:Transport acessory protein MmpS n=1 Tax=Mycobacterium vicinigordonae TaxID=1719132 RepID=A0A7D6ITR2_9MYCO|nr:MmpS family transport accessory protein [Mycobacterium vicinigordonae]QLL08599.1 transport acessory protein MmpS [Mycobacterium vicinigordonae]